MHGHMVDGNAILDFDNGWVQRWQAAGFYVVPWGWHEGDPVIEARRAVDICRRYGCNGYIANCEDAYEFGGAWRSKVFVEEFRRIAPRAPLGLSHIGEGFPFRQLDWTPWVLGEAAFLPQCYWARDAIGIGGPWAAATRAGLPLQRVYPTLGTSSFDTYYPFEQHAVDLRHVGAKSYSVWLLDSTPDDVLRVVQP